MPCIKAAQEAFWRMAFFIVLPASLALPRIGTVNLGEYLTLSDMLELAQPQYPCSFVNDVRLKKSERIFVSRERIC